MRLHLAGIIIASGLVTASPVLADMHWYIGGGVGANKITSLEEDNVDLTPLGDPSLPAMGDVEIKFKYGFNLNARIGAYITPNIRVEADLGYIDTGIDEVVLAGQTRNAEGDLWIGTGMINAIYDFKASPRVVTPFVGAGVGMAYLDIEDEGDEGLAATGFAGLSFSLPNRMRIEPSYNLLWLNGDGDDFYIHMFRVSFLIGLN